MIPKKRERKKAKGEGSFLSFEGNAVVRERLAEAVGYPSNSSIWSISSVSSFSSIWSVSLSVNFTKARFGVSRLLSTSTVVYLMVVAPFLRPYGGGFLQLRIPIGSPRELRSDRAMVFLQEDRNKIYI